MSAASEAVVIPLAFPSDGISPLQSPQSQPVSHDYVLNGIAKPKRLKPRSSSQGAVKAFNSSDISPVRPLSYLEVKYLGECPELPINGSEPLVVNIHQLLTEKKKKLKSQKGDMYFSYNGVSVIVKNQSTPIVSWWSQNIMMFASFVHPSRSNHRVALVKVHSGEDIGWHLFKYASRRKIDHMAECFQCLINQSLRDIATTAEGSSMHPSRLYDDVPPRYSGPEQSLIPSYRPASSSRRRLEYDQCSILSMQSHVHQPRRVLAIRDTNSRLSLSRPDSTNSTYSNPPYYRMTATPV